MLLQRESAPPVVRVARDPASRWRALDLLRCLAVLLMVQGHTFSVVLSEGEAAQGWHRWHSLAHGCTAPMFLFGAGLAFGVTTFLELEAHIWWSPAVWRRLRRYALIFLLGCALKLPGLSLVRNFDEPDRILQTLAFGPLHVIALVLAMAELLIALLGSRRRFAWSAAAIGAVIFVVSPWVWKIGAPAPDVLRFFLNNSSGSQFPLFPWGGFVCMGILAAHLALDAKGRPHRYLHLSFAIVGLALTVGTYVSWRAGVNPYGEHNFWRTSPLYTGFYLGLTCLWLALCGAIARVVPARAAPWVTLLGRQSLVIYVVHLFILYGSPLGPSLRAVGRTLGVPSAAAVTALVLVAVCALAFAWDRLRGHKHGVLVRIALSAAALYLLVIR